MDYSRNPVKAIRAHCIDCSGGSLLEPEKCPIERCELFPFRLGKNPFRKKVVISDTQKQKMIERLQRYRASQPSESIPELVNG